MTPAPAQGQPSQMVPGKEATQRAREFYAIAVTASKPDGVGKDDAVYMIAASIQAMLDEAGRLREENKGLLKTIMEQANFIVDQEHKLAAQSAEIARLKRDLLASVPVKVQVLINEFFATMNNFDKPTEKDEEIKRLREALTKIKKIANDGHAHPEMTDIELVAHYALQAKEIAGNG